MANDTVPAKRFPDIASDYQLRPEAISAFRRDGHITLRGVASASELAVYEPAIAEAVRKFNQEHRPLGERDTYGKAFLQVMNLWARDETVRCFTLARRFAKIAAELMGVPSVRIYHDQALFKEPFGGPTPWHQDQYYWPLDTNNMVTMWMPLVDVSVEMGPMTCATGTHKQGNALDEAISDQSEKLFEEHIKQRGYARMNAGMLAAGDATFHYGWTIHGAPENKTAKTRAVMTIIYFADGARAMLPANKYQEADLVSWLPGIKPGEPATSDLNPVVYRRQS